jgi:hypothetical protein
LDGTLNVKLGTFKVPRTKLPNREALAISKRLKEFATRRFESFAEFLRRHRIQPRTGKSWAKRGTPSVPDVPFLVRFAREANANLNWLLLGEGPDVRQREATTPDGQLLATIEAELRATEGVTEDEAQAVWNHLVIYRTAEYGYRAITFLAVEAVRPMYRELLRRERATKRLFRYAENWSAAFLRAGRISPEESRRQLQAFAQLLVKQLEPLEPELQAGSVRLVPEKPPAKPTKSSVP